MNQYGKNRAVPWAASLLIVGFAASGVAAQTTSGGTSGTRNSPSQAQGGTAGGNSSFSAADRALIQSLSSRLTPTEQRTFNRMMARLSSQERQVLLKVARGGSYGTGTTGAGGNNGSGTGAGTGSSSGTGAGAGGSSTGAGNGNGTGSGTGTNPTRPGTSGGGTTP